MAEKDKVIKSGQLTLPRILFLAVVGVLVAGMVAIGGKFLIIGYWVLTLAICGLLYLISIDYGIHMEKVDLTAQPVPSSAGEATPVSDTPRAAAPAEPRAKRRTSRPAKRRR
ncbi:MAG TPA: hypothetical protein VKA60_20485 [Blastocatellia bacterium]|nr:hypothetical protein [Blastocatellia bacterium]